MKGDYIQAFACYNKDERIRVKASSGGVFPLIANGVLRDGGVVYAVIYDENFSVTYSRITDMSDLEKCYGSKYVEARLGKTFKSVKEDLDKGKKVLFVGTPCHCEGLLSFLGEKNDSLLCVDFICHGVPSKRIWRSYIEKELKKNPLIKGMSMRSKEVDWKEFGLKFYLKNDRDIFESRMDNPYLRGFLRDLYLRPACHKCRFKGIERKTDITIGDFWGASELYDYEIYKNGISTVIVHSNTGLKCIDEIKEDLVTFDISADDIKTKNSGLVRSSGLTANREKFYQRYNNGEDFKGIVYDITGKTIASKLKKRIQSLLKNG